MSKQDLIDRVRAIVATHIDMNVDEVSLDTNMESAELWDSVAHVDITFALEEAFGIELTQDETEEMYSVQEIIAVLERRQIAA